MLSLTAAAAYVTLFAAVFDPKELPGELGSLSRRSHACRELTFRRGLGSLLNFVPVLLFTPFAFIGTLPLFVLRKQTISRES